MQITANDGFLQRLLRTDNARYTACTNIQSNIPLHFAAVCAFNCRRRGTTFVVINQRSIAADIDIGHIPAVAAAAIAFHTARVQVVAALHLNITRDFQIGIAHNIALIRAADHIVQTAGRGRVDITACRNHHIGAVYRCLVTAAVERFAQMDLTVFGENRPVTVAEQSAAGHIDIIKGAVTGQNTIRRKDEFLHFSLIAFHSNMLALRTKK